jgi:hypothetical protein
MAQRPYREVAMRQPGPARGGGAGAGLVPRRRTNKPRPEWNVSLYLPLLLSVIVRWFLAVCEMTVPVLFYCMKLDLFRAEQRKSFTPQLFSNQLSGRRSFFHAVKTCQTHTTHTHSHTLSLSLSLSLSLTHTHTHTHTHTQTHTLTHTLTLTHTETHART